MARALGQTEAEKDLYEWNARVQVTTWGNRIAADEGGLRDYAHKEWNGLLRDFYYLRWKTWFDELAARLGHTPNAAAQRLRRLRAGLRRALEQEGVKL